MESRVHKTERYMTTTEINYKGMDYTCRIVTSNEGESLIIGGLELLDALMPYPITDKCNGFANKEAERVDEEIFFYLKSASNLNGNLNCSKELEHYAS